MTSEFVSCPQCGESVDPQTWHCKYCGVSLALAALLAERDLAGSMGESNLAISPEILVPRLGYYLEENGILSAEDLESALKYQAEQDALGQQRLIGQTLLELGLVKKEQLDQVITEQILHLQSALQKANNELEDRVRERTAELESALNRLAELNQLKSNFIANISHELRTPLTHIRGYIEILIENDLGNLTNEQTGALAVMKKSEERLEQLIEDLIQFSLVARGELDLKIESIHLGEILDEVIFISQQNCKKMNITLTPKIPDELPKVRLDRKKIVWVLSELIENSIKFSPDNNTIRLEVSIGKNRVILSVCDTGIGIDQDRLEEIFEPFHQLDSCANRRYGGTGLGLAMAKQIVEAHGSKINVKTNLGEGSTFRFSLPMVGEK